MKLSHGVHNEHAIQTQNPNRILTYSEVVMWWQWVRDQIKNYNTDSEKKEVMERFAIESTSNLYYKGDGTLTFHRTTTRAPYLKDLNAEQQELLRIMHGGAILNAMDWNESNKGREIAPHKIGTIMIANEKFKVGDKVYDTSLESFGIVTQVVENWYDPVQATFEVDGNTTAFNYSETGAFFNGADFQLLKVVEDVQ